MKRLILVLLLAALASSCFRSWTGRPVAQLEKKFGTPWSVIHSGDNQIYYYPDPLAGGQMTFTIDNKGIVRSWCASNNVPGVFGDDPFGNADFGGSISTSAPADNPNSPVLNPPVSLARSNRGPLSRGATLPPNCR